MDTILGSNVDNRNEVPALASDPNANDADANDADACNHIEDSRRTSIISNSGSEASSASSNGTNVGAEVFNGNVGDGEESLKVKGMIAEQASKPQRQQEYLRLVEKDGQLVEERSAVQSKIAHILSDTLPGLLNTKAIVDAKIADARSAYNMLEAIEMCIINSESDARAEQAAREAEKVAYKARLRQLVDAL